MLTIYNVTAGVTLAPRSINVTAAGNTTTDKPLDDYNWYGLYYYLVVFFICLTGLCIILAKIIIVARRHINYRRLPARQRAQANGCDAATANGSACTEGSAVPKPADSPPSYDDAVQNYINAKQDLEAAEEGALAGNIPLNESTTTMETVLETGATVTEISRPSTVRRPTSNTTTTNTTTTNNRQNPNV